MKIKVSEEKNQKKSKNSLAIVEAMPALHARSASGARVRFTWPRAVSVALIVLLVLGGIIPPRLKVSAATDKLYPRYCLGGWQNPQLAGGELTVALGSNTSAYSGENSAVLKDTLADIFCGYFQSENHENAPKSAKISFSWGIDFNIYSPPAPKPPVVEPEPAPGEKPTPESVPIVEPEPAEGFPVSAQLVSDSAEATPTPQPAVDAPAQKISDDILDENPQDPNPTVDNPDGPNGQPQVLPAPSEVIGAPTGGGNPVSGDDQKISDGFLHVRYSFDGLTWQDGGSVTANNWQAFEVSVPVSSWDQLNSLQISLSAQPTFDRQPVIYLDGIEMAVDYDVTFAETVNDIGQGIADAIDTTISTVGDTLAALFDVFTPGEAKKEETAIVANEPAPEQPVVLAEEISTASSTPAETAVKHLLFSANSKANIVPAKTHLPWYSREDEARLPDLNLPAEIETKADITYGDDGRSATIATDCKQKYLVVLLYSKAEDYRLSPGSFSANQAVECHGGKGEFDLRQLRSDLATGDYYILLASQGAEGTWVPQSALTPITVGSIIDIEKKS